MINRVLIRIKVVQTAYAYYCNEDASIDKADNALDFSFSKVYDLYQHLLLLMVEITDYSRELIHTHMNRLNPALRETNPNCKFVENAFIAQLKSLPQLKEFAEKNGQFWREPSYLLKELHQQITASSTYEAYMKEPSTGYDADRELWRKLYREIICNNEALEQFLEDKSIFWNDDKTTVDSFVLKTIKRFSAESGVEQALLPMYNDDEDRRFAHHLLRQAILHADEYRALIGSHTRGWDMDRVGLMDILILQVALAEILQCPNIPISVSINEYVEIAKFYGSPKSSSFINGLLDNVATQLHEEGKLQKAVSTKR